MQKKSLGDSIETQAICGWRLRLPENTLGVKGSQEQPPSGTVLSLMCPLLGTPE